MLDFLSRAAASGSSGVDVYIFDEVRLDNSSIAQRDHIPRTNTLPYIYFLSNTIYDFLQLSTADASLVARRLLSSSTAGTKWLVDAKFSITTSHATLSGVESLENDAVTALVMAGCRVVRVGNISIPAVQTVSSSSREDFVVRVKALKQDAIPCIDARTRAPHFLIFCAIPLVAGCSQLGNTRHGA